MLNIETVTGKFLFQIWYNLRAFKTSIAAILIKNCDLTYGRPEEKLLTIPEEDIPDPAGQV